MDLARIIAAVLLRWTRPPSPKRGTEALGRWGERQAACFLKSHGCKILYRNYRPRQALRKGRWQRFFPFLSKLSAWAEGRLGKTFFLRKKNEHHSTQTLPRGGEIDLVARQGETLLFVEVKTRRRSEKFRPGDAIDRRKKRLIRQGVDSWMRCLGYGDITYRIDLIEVVATQPSQIHHIKSIFSFHPETYF